MPYKILLAKQAKFCSPKGYICQIFHAETQRGNLMCQFYVKNFLLMNSFFFWAIPSCAQGSLLVGLKGSYRVLRIVTPVSHMQGKHLSIIPSFQPHNVFFNSSIPCYISFKYIRISFPNSKADLKVIVNYYGANIFCKWLL